MALVADLAAGASAGAGILAIALAVLAFRAHRATGSKRSWWLGLAFGVSALQAGGTAGLLLQATTVSSTWLLIPLAHAAVMVLMYVALLRV